METIENNIKDVWTAIDYWMNNEIKLVSSEKSVVFNFAWEFNKKFNANVKKVDFETSLFENFSDGKFLDLFINFKHLDKEYRIGIEFKYPNKKKNNSNQTVTRQKIINDIKRLNWLVVNNKIDLGVFLCITNEDSYVSQGKFQIASEFLKHQGMLYRKGQYLPYNNFCVEKVVALNDILFDWNNVIHDKKKYTIPTGKFAFLKPVFIRKK